MSKPMPGGKGEKGDLGAMTSCVGGCEFVGEDDEEVTAYSFSSRTRPSSSPSFSLLTPAPSPPRSPLFRASEADPESGESGRLSVATPPSSFEPDDGKVQLVLSGGGLVGRCGGWPAPSIGEA